MRYKKSALLIFLLLLMAGCAAPELFPGPGMATIVPTIALQAPTEPASAAAKPTAPAAAQPTAPAAAKPSAPAAAPLTPTPTGTPAASSPGSCGYAWANKDLPDVTQQLSQAYKDAGMAEVEARASAYGENCLDAKTGKVVSFSIMETDFYLTIPVQDNADTQAMGDWIAKALPVIEKFPAGQVPGPQPGYVGIRFKSSANEVNLWFQRKTGEDLLKQGIKGSKLFDALKSP